MIANIEENRSKVAEFVADCMSLDDLIANFKYHLIRAWKDNNQAFQAAIRFYNIEEKDLK